MDGVDDGGDLDPPARGVWSKDHGLRLYDPGKRGLPASPRPVRIQIARLQRGDHAAQLLDALEVGARLPRHLPRERLHEVAAAERIDRVRHARFMREYLLRPQR